MKRLIGIDIGGTQTKAVCCSESGAVLARVSHETGDAFNAWRDVMHDVVRTFENEQGPADCVGVSCPGIGRPDGSGISWMIGRMEGVVNFDFTAHLNRKQRVPVLNDALAALLGEAWTGAARGVEDAILFTLGTGVGGAILSGGKLVKGYSGRAGHLGHLTVDADGPLDICNTPGSIEHAIGNYSLADRTGGRFTSTAELVKDVANDTEAHAVWRRSVRHFAAAIASVINVVDPQRVIVGGGMIAAGPMLFDLLAKELARVEWRPLGVGVEVVPAQLGEWAGAIGAARNAFEGGN
ncbi:MAG TPA: ROK family protein, partial [Tepidisphaeraceae bacterium]